MNPKDKTPAHIEFKRWFHPESELEINVSGHLIQFLSIPFYFPKDFNPFSEYYQKIFLGWTKIYSLITSNHRS